MATLITNSYCDLTAFKQYFAENGITDSADDNVIAGILNGTSRWIDSATRQRVFYPVIEARLFSLPNSDAGWRSFRKLYVDRDLLECTTLTNGNADVISASAYYLEDPNFTPRYAVVLKETSGVVWQYSLTGNREYVISVEGVWGYHDDLPSAFAARSLLTAGVNASVTSVAVTTATGALFSNGMIVKVGAEYIAVDSVATDTLTVRRGVNGSTAAAHLLGDAVYQYIPMTGITEATKRIGLQAYRRFGNASASGQMQVTAAGIVITPKDVSALDAQLLESLKSRRITGQY